MRQRKRKQQLAETVHLLRSPANAAELLQSIKDLDGGRGIEFDPTTRTIAEADAGEGTRYTGTTAEAFDRILKRGKPR